MLQLCACIYCQLMLSMWVMAKDPDEHMTERIIIPVTPTMLEEIKEYWHERRLNSKSEAIRRLIEVGLETERKKKKS